MSRTGVMLLKDWMVNDRGGHLRWQIYHEDTKALRCRPESILFLYIFSLCAFAVIGILRSLLNLSSQLCRSLRIDALQDAILFDRAVLVPHA